MAQVLARSVLGAMVVVAASAPGPAEADDFGDPVRYHRDIENGSPGLEVDVDLRLEIAAQPGGQGSARTLRGLVCLQHIFVDDAATSWTAEGERDSLRAVAAAQRFLVERAAARGIALRFASERVRVRIPGHIVDDHHDHLWTDEAVRRALATLARRPCRRRGRPSFVRVLHVAKVGRSYALPQPHAWDERVVMFRRELGPMLWEGAVHRRASSRVELAERPAAFAHEILHAFGAEDLYRPEARRKLAEQRYPSDLMLQPHRGLGELSVSTYTAHAVGWADFAPAPLPR